EVTIRNWVIAFIILIAFLWIPSIKSKINFNESFMATFKAVFVAMFFTGVLYLGIILIIGATDTLIFDIDERAYPHAANIVFSLLTPIYFLSLIPFYPKKGELLVELEGEKSINKEDNHKADETSKVETILKDSFAQKDSIVGTDKITDIGADETTDKTTNEIKDIANVADRVTEATSVAKKDKRVETISTVETDSISESEIRRNENLKKAIQPVKFLETLISYVVIPITAVFTIILLIYIIMNITGDFWTDNLLEPMLVAYSITVMIVYLLASTLKNALATKFRLIFPKVLVPIVLFQTLSSVLKIGEVGVTYGRYYVILFGLFATIAGIIFCILPVRKNGLIAPILLVLSVISVLPPIDAFTVSKANQINRLEKVLLKNDMLQDNVIIPKSDLSEDDQVIITTAISYLDGLNYTKNVDWLTTYINSYDFGETFGFTEYAENDIGYSNFYLQRDFNSPISVEGYDYMNRMNTYDNAGNISTDNFEIDGKTYQLYLKTSSEKDQSIVLSEVDGQDIIQFDMNDIYAKYKNSSASKDLVPSEEVTFKTENALAKMTIVIEYLNMSQGIDGKYQQAELFVLVDMK
ncbi:MAG: DUF4153 domain-containing protein, partial [Mobilitalea sp.]